MNKPISNLKFRHLYFISFIEGGVVMVTELAGAKILTPFFGASLYSWASTLSITLLALMSGYYAGGYATTQARFSSDSKIVRIFLLSGLAVCLMPSLGSFIMEKTISFSFFSGLIISELFFLFLPVFLMGMISPMIIFHITKTAEQSGRSAGTIYAISTFGGIVFTMIFGFLIIPYYGITVPVRMLGLAVAITGLTFIIKEKVNSGKKPVALFLALTLIALAFSQRKELPLAPNKKIIEYSEGLLGELKVIDELVYDKNNNPVTTRKLKTNNIQQNFVFANMPTQSLMYYVNFLNQVIKFIPQKKSALLVGLGAGSLYSVLSGQNMSVETVEIDQRIYDIGIKYFGMPGHKNHFITDGRYFINTTQKKYDLIILDVIIGENVPAQLITLESFKRCREILDDKGYLIIEHGGLNSFSDNAFIPSMLKTLSAAGFEISVFNPLLSSQKGDLVIIAGKTKFDPRNISISDDVSIKGGPLSDYLLPVTIFDTSSANILRDDVNNSDILLKSHYFKIRESIRKDLARSRLAGKS